MYAMSSGVGAVYNSFLPVYLNQIGFTGAMVGTLLAIAPFMVLIAQPFWGMAGDRTKSINRLMRWIMGGSAVAVVCYPLSQNFYFLFVMISIFSFFNSVMFTMQDVLTLQSIEHKKWRYGSIRLSATISFAIISILAGIVAEWNIVVLFPLTAFLAVLTLLVTFKMPNIRGHQTPGNRVSPLVILKNKDLVLFTAFSFFVILTYGYFSNFFSIYFIGLGADKGMIGIFWFISAVAEVPFLLFADRIIARLGIRSALILAAIVMGVRWLILFFSSDVYVTLLTSVMHGFSFIVILYCMATYINNKVPKELKSSGQSFFALFGGGIPRIIASVAGGIANDLIGIQKMFLVCAIINALTVLVLGILFYLNGRKNQELVIVDDSLPLRVDS
jgi:PPP family 3-phenylpropionic acid transporter